MYYFIFLLVFSVCLQASNWIHLSNERYCYAYASGLFSSETQLAKYCPEFIATTGQKVVCNSAINVIQNVVRVTNLSEISLMPRNVTTIAKDIINKAIITVPILGASYVIDKYLDSRTGRDVTTLLAGLGSCVYTLWNPLNYSVAYAQNKKFGFSIASNSETDLSVSGHVINLFKINLAQEKDIALYKNSIQDLIDQSDTEKKVILYGVSRGSATVFNTFAQLEQENNTGNIAAVICEGIFDSVPNIAKHSNLFNKIQTYALMYSGLTQFDRNGISPLSQVQHIKSQTPIALITSVADRMVPCQCTINLYNALKKQGCNVHILILKNSAHPLYPCGSEKEIYQNFVHAFYQKHGLPYIAEFAVQGQELINKSTPEAQDNYDDFINNYFEENFDNLD